MVKCPSCGASSIFDLNVEECLWCSVSFCSKCLEKWDSEVAIKDVLETSHSEAEYQVHGFCSSQCTHQFWKKVLSSPDEKAIGTDIAKFEANWQSSLDSSILDILTKHKSSNVAEEARKAFELGTAENPAFLCWDSNGNPSPQAHQFRLNARLLLAQNLEKCGRTLDAAKIYEELQNYDRARTLREQEKQVVVRNTNVSVDINSLLQQIKDNGVVAVYRCPYCGGKLKIAKDTEITNLRKCEHCGSDIEALELMDFLKAVLS